jgi:hypothetical protein
VYKEEIIPAFTIKLKRLECNENSLTESYTPRAVEQKSIRSIFRFNRVC